MEALKIYHTPRDSKQQWADSTDTTLLAFERKELPGAGAGQYAWEVLGLPVYWPFGNSAAFVTNPLRETSPFSYAYHAVGLVGVPAVGVIQGQFATQPLIDTTSAQNIGALASNLGAGVGDFNQIPTGS